ncbi:MAG TPA: MXAN_5187 family protein [Polyangiaceae bacterium]|nr:MXAN_5187 family protein [Polyangiaceae bacterium]
MLLSRFWSVLLALVIGASVFVLSLAVSMYNRSGARFMGEALSSDSQVVSWYLRDDARQRSAQLIQFALNQEIAKLLLDSSESESRVPDKARDRVTTALRQIAGRIPPEASFDAVFAVDQHGRVVAHLGYEQASGMQDFELGGYPVVADALHGYIRDDTLVLDRVYRVVARPVEYDLGQLPAGAVIGARIIDDRFARELSQRTGAAIAFYSAGQRVASGAPEGFDKSQLDQIVADLSSLQSDKEYLESGRSQMRTLGPFLGVQYSRLPGEAWDLGAGYAVARIPARVSGPLGFLDKADDKDKAQANVLLALLVALGLAAVGIVLSLLEHTRPLHLFRNEAQRLAKGETDQLQPSRFRGAYRKIAADLNDGIEKVAAKGGVPRRAADLSQVLGDLPDQPQMSAFTFPGEAGAVTPPPGTGRVPMPASGPGPTLPTPGAGRAVPFPEPVTSTATGSVRGPAGPAPPPPPRRAASDSSVVTSANSPAASGEQLEWRQVFEEFVATKRQCDENIDGFTFEKFEQTLRKNREALIKRHGAKQVKFSVYVKDGKAALKASPIKE